MFTRHTKAGIAVGLAITLAAVVLGNNAEAATKKAAITLDQPITYTFAGDSVTALPGSWKDQLADPDLISSGGYAVAGNTSAQVLAGVTANAADVLVIEVGTNDVKYGVNEKTVADNIVKIAAKVRANHVLLVALPPSNITDDATTHVNRQVVNLTMSRWLSQVAADNGYMYADPFSAIRAYWGAYGGSLSDDGTHPNFAANTKVAARMSLYIKQAAQAIH